MPREHPESTVCGCQGTRPGIRTVDCGPGRHKKRGDELPSPRCSPRMYVFDYGLDVMKIRVPSRILQANFIIGPSQTLSRHCTASVDARHFPPSSLIGLPACDELIR